jgi:hypothetical protein
MLPGKKTDKKSSQETDWDALRAFMPMSFGKQEAKRDLSLEFDKTKREVSLYLYIYINKQALIVISIV